MVRINIKLAGVVTLLTLNSALIHAQDYSARQMNMFPGSFDSFSINNAGQVGGGSGGRCFRWTNGVLEDLQSGSEGTSMFLPEMNDSGTLVGSIRPTQTTTRAVRFDSSLHVLPAIQGEPNAAAESINNAGLLAGYVSRQSGSVWRFNPAYFSNNSWTVLPSLTTEGGEVKRVNNSEFFTVMSTKTMTAGRQLGLTVV